MRSEPDWDTSCRDEQHHTWQRLVQERMRIHLPPSRPAELSQRQWLSQVVRACERAEREATDELLFTEPRTYTLDELLAEG